MRDRLPIIALATALLVGVLVMLLSRASDRGDFAEPLSTYRSKPDGARALYLLAERMHLPVERRHLDLEQIDGHPVLVMLGSEGDKPEAPFGFDAGTDTDVWHFERLTKYESTELLRAVDDGATLLYAISREHPLLEELKVQFTRAEDPASRTLLPLTPSPFVEGVRQVQTRISGYVSADGALPLLIDDHDPDRRAVALLLSRGKGRVLVLAAPTMAANRDLAQEDNAAFLLDALRALQPEPHSPIQFDEFHHGFSGERSVARYASRYGLPWIVAQGLFALFLWTIALRRLGTMRPPQQDQQRGGADYLLAMARIYQLGKHRTHAAEALVRGVVRQLQGVVSLPRTASLDQVAEALAHQGRTALSSGLRELRDQAKADPDEAALLNLSRKAAALRQGARRAAETKSESKTESKGGSTA